MMVKNRIGFIESQSHERNSSEIPSTSSSKLCFEYCQKKWKKILFITIIPILVVVGIYFVTKIVANKYSEILITKIRKTISTTTSTTSLTTSSTTTATTTSITTSTTTIRNSML
ncbi:unnamed protein product [Adineta ricciae]|uniref:Uncharacterized protein n=1 Tax=Adineta ricciae TaxID=249248 RepID=A0A815HTE6_ADIRI|nr:unnamed protein product [Adineta ricciae]